MTNTFKDWFKENLADSAHDIASHGADCGFPGITYTSDCVKLFDQFGHEIWDMAVEDAKSLGHKNVAEMISHFGRADMMEGLDQFKNLMVWYACEKLAREVEDSDACDHCGETGQKGGTECSYCGENPEGSK